MSFVAATTFACGSQYAYVPTTNATATISGRTASEYQIPPEAPRGDVRIASFGMTNLTAKTNPEQGQIRALHLRLMIDNNSDTPWQLDTREQRLDLSGYGPSAPAFASASPGPSLPPIVTIAAGGKRTVDLFFPLPPNEQHASKVPSFDALWRIKTGNELVAERSPFERIYIEPAASDYDYGIGGFWGEGPYWYDRDYNGWGMGIGEPYINGPGIGLL
jgi:hypothetical protein